MKNAGLVPENAVDADKLTRITDVPAMAGSSQDKMPGYNVARQTRGAMGAESAGAAATPGGAGAI